MIGVRREHPAFGVGDYTELDSSNPSVLAFARRHATPEGEDVVVCVNNLSRFPQPVEVRLPAREGDVPVELTGGVAFPAVGEQALYRLTLPGYGFYWFAIRSSEVTP
ncbi:hypothetical protein AC529_07005 [Thermobifida cellulosilytica TB100]|uniref:Maltogenic amylase-like C-terminal domain-containing protein n=2 Tax=Thermobifida cellulosilytica TaxID=144786 RepID=A0A147KJF1_THECS|nr:hypothetical protein AC529_07005 [Thermobifida cellulosilytica TB100]